MLLQVELEFSFLILNFIGTHKALSSLGFRTISTIVSINKMDRMDIQLPLVGRVVGALHVKCEINPL